MRLISAYNPESFGRKVAKRHPPPTVRPDCPLRDSCHLVHYDINPSDLKNPVVLRVAGIDIHPHLDRQELNRLRRLHAIGNPTIVAQYFHFVVESFSMHGFRRNFHHFAVVEENNRHILHLHAFAWVTGNMNFTDLQDRVLADLDFRNRLVSYLQASIPEVVDEIWASEYKEDNHPYLPPAFNAKNNQPEAL